MTLKETLGQRIKDQMRECNVTQLQLAEKLGVHQTTVSTWVKGEKTPHFDTLEKIADVLHTSVVELLDNGNEKVAFVEKMVKERPEIEPLLYEASKVPPDSINFAMEFLQRLNSTKIRG